MKAITKKDIKKLEDNKVIKNTHVGFVNKNGDKVSVYITCGGTVYIEDRPCQKELSGSGVGSSAKAFKENKNTPRTTRTNMPSKDLNLFIIGFSLLIGLLAQNVPIGNGLKRCVFRGVSLPHLNAHYSIKLVPKSS